MGNLCYTHDADNIAIIYAQNDYFGVSFFKGALTNDPDGLLYQRFAQMQSARLFWFSDLAQLQASASQSKAFVADAIEIENAGIRADMIAKNTLVYPPKLQNIIDEDGVFASAFDALTHGRKRGYVLYIEGAKQAKTRYARIGKYVEHILDGKGIHSWTTRGP